MTGPGRVAGLLLACLACNSGARCQKQNSVARLEGRRGAASRTVRDVRVLLVDRQTRCRVDITGGFSIRSAAGVLYRGRDVESVVIAPDRHGGIVFGDRELGRGVFDVRPEPAATLRLAVRDGARWLAPRRYPGFLRLSVNRSGRLRVVNYVDIETYVACVLPGEMPPRFHPEAQRAQTVAIRTYVLYQMASRSQQSYDVRATEASQVYHGLPTGRAFEQARRAAAYTRGIVGTWTSPSGERIVCTFYSACCGGVTQSVAACKPGFPPIKPLAGGVHCDCYKTAGAKTFRWAPVELSKDEITRRLLARYPAMTTLGPVDRITVAERTRSGRPQVLEIAGAAGRSTRLTAEDFRLAIGSRTLRSTDFTIRNEPDRIVFANGKGFGHGVGLCQWGAQAMALEGHRAGDILKHYYPTMNLTRAY